MYLSIVRRCLSINLSTYLPTYQSSIYRSIHLIIYPYPQPWAQSLCFRTIKEGQPELEYAKLRLLATSSFFSPPCLLCLFPSGPHFSFCYPSWLSTTPLLVQKLIEGHQCSNLLAQLLSTLPSICPKAFRAF